MAQHHSRFPPGGRIVKSLLRFLSVFALTFCLAGFAPAEDKKPADKKDDKKPIVKTGPFSFPKQIALTEDQQKKLDELKTEYQSKLEEATKKIDAISATPERKKARAEAEKKAKDDGKNKKEIHTAVYEANKYTDDEKKDLKELGTARGKLMSEIEKKKKALLTEEQIKALQPKPKDKPAPEKDKPAPAKDKPAKDKPAPEKDKPAPEKDKKTEK